MGGPSKSAVIAAVRAGKITMEEALRRYQLTAEEFLSWQRALESHGLPGLRATRIQRYREPRRSRGRGDTAEFRPPGSGRARNIAW